MDEVIHLDVSAVTALDLSIDARSQWCPGSAGVPGSISSWFLRGSETAGPAAV